MNPHLDTSFTSHTNTLLHSLAPSLTPSHTHVLTHTFAKTLLHTHFRTVIFQDDEEVVAPLWRRIVASLPEGLMRGSAGSSSSSIASIGSGSSASSFSISDDAVEFVEGD